MRAVAEARETLDRLSHRAGLEPLTATYEAGLGAKVDADQEKLNTLIGRLRPCPGKRENAVLVVGHQPTLSRIADQLLNEGRPRPLRHAPTPLDASGVVCEGIPDDPVLGRERRCSPGPAAVAGRAAPSSDAWVLYQNMMRIWRNVFLLAAVLAMAATGLFAFAVLRAGSTLVIAAVVAVLVIPWWVRRSRPALGSED